jgi:hypothetical protein
MIPGANKQVWISAVTAARRLGCVPRQIPRLARRGLLTVRRLPGCDPRYLLADVERLAREVTVVSTRTTAGRARINSGVPEQGLTAGSLREVPTIQVGS